MDMSKSKLLGSFFLLFLASSLHAGLSWPQVDGISKDGMSTEKRIEKISENKISGITGVKHPIARFCQGNESLFFSSTLLYWQSFNHGFRFASANRPPNTTPHQQQYYNMRFYEVDYDWHPGFRVDLGYFSRYDDWEAWATWTWYLSSNDAKFTEDNFWGGLKSPRAITSPFLPKGLFQYSFGHWRLTYNTMDVQMGRSYFLTKALSLKPLLGIRTGSLYQSYKIKLWNDPKDVVVGQNNTLTSTLQAHSNYWGVGPRIGCDARVDFLKNFGMNGTVSGSLLYGKRMAKEKLFRDMYTQGSFTGLVERSKDRFDYFTVAPTVQVNLGLDWGKGFLKNHFFLGMGVCWEFNYWWDQFHFSIPQETGPELLDEAVEMQGMNFRLFCAF